MQVRKAAIQAAEAIAKARLVCKKIDDAELKHIESSAGNFPFGLSFQTQLNLTADIASQFWLRAPAEGVEMLDRLMIWLERVLASPDNPVKLQLECDYPYFELKHAKASLADAIEATGWKDPKHTTEPAPFSAHVALNHPSCIN